MAAKVVLCLFGGQSSEHRVSCMSAAFVVSKLRETPSFDVLTCGISHDGRWLLTTATTEAIAAEQWEQHPDNRRLLFTPDATAAHFYVMENEALTPLDVDVVFPVLHGKNGEDGTMQGLFDLAGIPYVGCGTLASAVAMDKDIAKRVFATAGIAQLNYLTVRQHERVKKDAQIREDINKRIGYPCFVKPANAGSSVGVSKVKSEAQLAKAMDEAFLHDRKILVEQASSGREIEVSVYGADGHVFVSVAGEIKPGQEFYDYNAKYDDPNSTLIIPAELDADSYARIVDMATRAFNVAECRGLCRADFFVEPSQIYLNEINTMPGFTGISMYPKLMEHSGTNGRDLVYGLVNIALQEE